jgi:hypothetical protein
VPIVELFANTGNSINTDKRKKGGKKPVVRSWGIFLGCVNLRLGLAFV